MRRWLVFALLFGLIISPSPVSAQGSTKLDSIHIELLSEYDQPSMLVINQFIVAADTPLPAAVQLRFPKEGNLIAVAEQKNGELFDKDFTPPVEQGDWRTVTVNVESYEPHRIEYYQPLVRDGNKRQFKYQWFGDYSVKEFTIQLVVPSDSTELNTSPALESTSKSPNEPALVGMIAKNELKMGNSFQFEFEYLRTSDTLIAPAQAGPAGPVQPSEPVGPDTEGRVSIENLPLIIGGFGLGLIAIALFSYWRSTQSGEVKPFRRRRAQNQGEADGQAYCHGCGTRAYTGDRFCRTCGSRLRVE